MALQDYANAIVDFVRNNSAWAAPVMFGLAFGESLAFLSLLLPAWAALVAIGTLLGSSGISFWPIWIAAAAGAALGDGVSYWLGWKFGPAVANVWPLSRYPELLPRGQGFVTKWGALAILIGKFFGPLRASVPLAAGIFRMPIWSFGIATIISALVWAAMLLLLGDVFSRFIAWIWP